MKIQINKHILMSVYSDDYEVKVNSNGYKQIKKLCFSSAKKSSKTLGIPFFPDEVIYPECIIDENVEEDFCIINKLNILN